MGQQGRRPIQVTILAIWFFLNGISIFLGGLSTMFVPLPGGLGNYTLVVGIVGVLFGALCFAIGWGMLQGQDWSRITALVLSVILLLSTLFAGVVLLIGINIGGYTLNFPGVGAGLIFLAILEGLVIYYLLTAQVEEWFSPSIPAPAPLFPPPQRDTEPHYAGPVPVQAESPPPARAAWIVMQGGSRRGKEFGLVRGHNVIGRDAGQCDIIVDDSTVSKRHADLNWENGQFVLHDLVSTNHTFVNNRRVERQSLLDEDEVRFGNARFIFKQVKSHATR